MPYSYPPHLDHDADDLPFVDDISDIDDLDNTGAPTSEAEWAEDRDLS